MGGPGAGGEGGQDDAMLEAAAMGGVMLPPYRVIPDFFEPAAAQDLLDYALSREADFKSTVLESGAGDAAIRKSVSLQDLSPFAPLFEDQVRGRARELGAQIWTSVPDHPIMELELAAHNDGAFYRPHIDTLTAENGLNGQARTLSGVYYFHAQPKGFEGGALRLHAMAGQGFVDIEPRHNSLLLFPSWALHEVRPVACPSGRFADSRFAINCWIYSPPPGV